MATTMHQAGVPEWTMADRLRKAREVASMSQEDLAAAIGVSRRSITKYENGGGEATRPVRLSWALATGVSLDWLETGQVPRFTPDDGGNQGSDLPIPSSRCIAPDAGPMRLAA